MHVAKPTKIGVVVIAALLASVVTVSIAIPLLRGGGDSTSESSRETTTSSGAAPVAPTTTTADAARSHASPSKRSAADREAMLAAIAKARQARDLGTSTSARDPKSRGSVMPTSTGATGTTLDITDNTGDTSEWQQRALSTLNSLLGQCYDLGRAEDPELAGTIKIRFRLVGEPGVGALLERVEIVDPDTTITQQTIRTCFAEQLYALELDPPPDGLTVERELDLHFTP